ncbi:hypothetical protein M422DRAFT_255818 [Sphaerobolus stellatus SS14]|uniref:Uncharacterized protein n=1 Tax=Sphaerobolus stellatus (strain SS14) TaxID=990650 RepID=A0A0C9UE61_SPHS4|nr:hypothetical protein M422DRAFT_255818 [Sphaerobolus stellatus SS14]
MVQNGPRNGISSGLLEEFGRRYQASAKSPSYAAASICKSGLRRTPPKTAQNDPVRAWLT